MTNPAKRYKNRPILTDSEIADMLKKADKIKNEFFKLRVKALIALAKKFGKRRIEISTLERADLKSKDGYLHVTFTIRKKHKKGLFQYIKYLKAKIAKGEYPETALTDKPYSQLVEEWKVWQETIEGYRIKEEKREKKISLEDKYVKHILEYLDYSDMHHADAKFLFPSAVCYFGQTYIMDNGNHLTGRQLLRLIKPLNPTAWLHLLRETKGAEIARDMGMTISAVAEVRNTLDLEDDRTALRYVHRYAVQELKPEK